MNFQIFIILCHFYLIRKVFCVRLHEQIYLGIDSAAACFRRLNGTHQAGCSSSSNGAIGVVHMVNSVEDSQWLVFNGSSPPYVAVISTVLFEKVIENLVAHPKNIAGILLYEDKETPTMSFSQESRCPNEYSSAPGSQCAESVGGGVVWNVQGTGLIRRDIPFPIFYVPKSQITDIEKIRDCYMRFNDFDKVNQKSRSLCSLQMSSFMFAAVNSEVCMRRSSVSSFFPSTKMCDPLGDRNIYYTLFPRGKEAQNGNRTVTLVTARIDAASLFDGLAPGGASSIVGMVTFITAASILSKMIPVSEANKYKHNIIWTLLNGESFDYIGSQSVAYDLSRGKWPPATPLDPAKILLHLEIGQLGGSLASNDSIWPLTAFIPSYTPLPQEIEEFLPLLTNLTLNPMVTNNIPPSSLHSFRRILRNLTESGQLPEMLLVDHKETYTNMFYQSVLDDARTIKFKYHNISIDKNGTFVDTEVLLKNGTMKESDPQVKIARLATVLSQALYRKVTGDFYNGTVKASAHMVDELLYCFLSSQNCQILKAADYANSDNNEDDVPIKPESMYVGVSLHTMSVQLFAGHLLALLTGNNINVNQTTCNSKSDSEFSYYWLRGWNKTGVCIQTTMNYSQALSPAFSITDYDYASGQYSTWTESVWQTMWVRLFVAASGDGARAAAITGSALTILASVLTYWLKRHAGIIFKKNVSSLVVTIDGDGTSGMSGNANF